MVLCVDVFSSGVVPRVPPAGWNAEKVDFALALGCADRADRRERKEPLIEGAASDSRMAAGSDKQEKTMLKKKKKRSNAPFKRRNGMGPGERAQQTKPPQPTQRGSAAFALNQRGSRAFLPVAAKICWFYGEKWVLHGS